MRSRLWHIRSCKAKWNYETLTAARKGAQIYMNEQPGLQLYAYQCLINPGHWHLTRKDQTGSVPLGVLAR